MNMFRKTANDPKIQKLYKNKPIHMALLSALANATDKGLNYLDLPWFSMTKAVKERNSNGKVQP